MSISFISLKCPECGANLEVKEGYKHIFCSYCGAKIMICNENEHIIHYYDEAEIEKSHDKTILKLKEMELIEKRRSSLEKANKIKQYTPHIIALIAICLILTKDADFSFIGVLLLLAAACIGFLSFLSRIFK